MSSFVTAAATFNNTTTKSMEGVIVVDVWSNDKSLNSLDDKDIPNGINVHGTLLFNFLGSGWDPTTGKIVVTAALNINPADLSHLNPTVPSTYTTGYPPAYSDPSKNPTNINIVPYGYQNVLPGDDLPALLYSIGVVDIHGPVDISGVVYTPSYMEIENSQKSQTQYFKGSVIMGYGIYYQNNQSGNASIISFDPNTLDSLSTLNSAGKQVRVAYWQ
jgi:hypothetical protein